MIKRLFVLILLLLPLLTGCASPDGGLFAWTGEEGTAQQIYGVVQLAASELRPQPQTADDVAVAHAGVSPFGINTFLEQEVEPWKREKSVQMIAEAGFHWLRQEFPWEDIEIHGKGDFEDRRHEPHRSAWEKYDHIVDLAEEYELELVPRLSNPPAWTRAMTDTVGAQAPPDDLDDWGDFVSTVVSRYQGRIRYYQLWNEPNIYPEWGERPVDPEAYTELLCEGYRRAKEADPNAVIVSGALAPTISLHPGPGPSLGMNEMIFLQRMYDAGAGECFDILAVNDYLLWSAPTDHRLHPYIVNFSRPMYVRDIMVANGDAHKPIWISEMNANAVPDDPSIQNWQGYGQVTLEQQARYAPLAYERVMEEWPWAGVVNFWFFKRPSDAERDQSWYYFRMVEPDFAPLPVYNSMKAYTSDLVPTLYKGVHQEDHWALDYQGGWETVSDPNASLGAYRVATETGAAVTFTFEGKSLALNPGPEAGGIEISVDGGPGRQIPVSQISDEPVQLVDGGGGRSHQVTITVVAGGVAIDEFLVDVTK